MVDETGEYEKCLVVYQSELTNKKYKAIKQSEDSRLHQKIRDRGRYLCFLIRDIAVSSYSNYQRVKYVVYMLVL
jgi:hypothetical protein